MLNVTLQAISTAAVGASALNLTAVGLSDNDTNDLTISPPITSGVDSSDGVITVNSAAVAPQLVSVVINGADTFKNTNQRSQLTSIVISFNAPVVVSAGAFTLENLGLVTSQTPLALSLSQILIAADPNQQVYTLRFGMGNGVVTRSGVNGTGRGHSLADGNYRLTIDPTKVTAGGQNLSATNSVGDGDNQFGDIATDEFYRMLGDGNGDGVVSTIDTAAFRAALTAYDSAFDADGDGVVLNAGIDRNSYLANFGKRRRRF